MNIQILVWKIRSPDQWCFLQCFACYALNTFLLNDLSNVEFSCVILSNKQRQAAFALSAFLSKF